MVRDQIVADEKKIIQDLKIENGRILQDKYALEKQLGQIQAQRKKLQAENKKLGDQLDEVKRKLTTVNIPSDPSALVRELQQYLGPVRIRK